jgi:hypothetical protein
LVAVANLGLPRNNNKQQVANLPKVDCSALSDKSLLAADNKRPIGNLMAAGLCTNLIHVLTGHSPT